jgi:pyruvate formate lyase activating enzyme
VSDISPVPAVVPTRYWPRLDDGRVQCDVCPLAGKLGEGQRGRCVVGGNLQVEVVLSA